MLYKFALCECSPINLDSQGNMKMVKTAAGKIFVDPGSDKAKIIEAEIKKHPTSLFFRSKAIKADEPNSNGDYFSEKELVKAYKSFEGVPFFTNHNNQNIENARGKIIFAEWVPEEKSVYTISFVDREAFPHICRSIEEEYVTGVSMGALSGGTKILMSDLTEKNIEEVNADDMVMSHTLLPRKVKMVHNEYLGKKMYSFDLVTYHKSPLFTNDHPIMVIDKEQMQEARVLSLSMAQSNKYERSMGRTEEFIGQDGWRNSKYSVDPKYAESVCEGDNFLIPSKYKLVKGCGEDKDLSYVLGVYLGDGYLKKDRKGGFESVSFCLGIDELELADKITKILKRYTNAEVSTTICPDRNGMYLNFYDRKLAKKFYDLVGTGSKDKRIKFGIGYVDNAVNLISGYLDTDGCIVDKDNQIVRGNKFGGMQISSANISLLEDIQSLLIALGYVSRISTMERIPGKNSIVKVNTTEHTLSIGSNACSILTPSIKLSNFGIRNAEIKAGKTFITEIDGLKYMVCPVKNIEVIDYKEPVYDLTVEEDESYIADGVAVHNCSVDFSVCNLCENRAEKTDDYCSHIKERKGRRFTGRVKNVKTGEIKDFKNELVFEYNYGIKFIELSAVVDPACPSCRIEGIIPNDGYLTKVANLQNSMFMIKEAALVKEASQEEVDKLNQALQTLEEISINLVKNRKQVEVEFASDLVKILSELQTFVDELVGAGYGSVQGSAVPGVTGAPESQPPVPPAPEAGVPGAPPALGAAPQPMPVSATTPAAGVGAVTGSPSKPLVATPKLPITAPVRPRASEGVRMEKVSNLLDNLNKICQKGYNEGEEDMSKRRTVAEKMEQKKNASEVLSTLWKEKQEFSGYINKLPSIQNNANRLSVMKRDDSFIIVAESKGQKDWSQVWTYDDLTDKERVMIKESPQDAAEYFMDRFAVNLNNKKEGVNNMADNIKEAGAQSVNKQPEVITEAQLENTKDLYHPRTGEEKDVITQKQLDGERKNAEVDVITEAQLEGKTNKLNPRTGEEKDVITQKQLDSVRKESEADVITQKQLDGNRTGTEPEVITEKQLSTVDAPWSRAASSGKVYKSAGDHMSAVVNVLADTSIVTGCTPEEACGIASSLVGSTKDRVELSKAVLEAGKGDDVDYSKRLAYWSKKNIKIASSGAGEIADAIVKGLKKVASDASINVDTIIDAMDVVSEDKTGSEIISKRIDEKLAEAKKEVVRTNKKDELRSALKSISGKEARDEERKAILASVESEEKDNQKLTRETERAIWEKAQAVKSAKADHMIETSFAELGCAKEDQGFRTAIKSFARGALASQNMKLASITNVTIDGSTISIAVQTDEGEQSVDLAKGSLELPVGGEGMDVTPEVPEADLSGEGLESSLPPATTGTPAPAPSPVAAGPIASSKAALKKTAQVGGMGGGVPQTPGGVAAPGSPEAGMPGGMPGAGGEAVSALTTDEASVDEIPTAGEQQMPFAICPECGSSDVDVTSEDGGNIKGSCKGCGAEYEGLIKKTIEFKIIKPTKSVGEEGAEVPEVPEVPALPVAAQTKLDKNSLTRMASNKASHGHVCPACGMKQCKASKEEEGHAEYKCPACNTDVEKNVLINVNKPDEAYMRVQWDLIPKADCKGCEAKAKRLASLVKVTKMMRSAQSGETKFPMANCVELLARKYGGNSTATYGPCKGKALADCVCGQLEKLGLTKVRHLEKLAGTYMQKDPMEECIADKMAKQGLDVKKASFECECMKRKFASDNPGAMNIFAEAFGGDIDSGKEKFLNHGDIDVINGMMGEDIPSEVPVAMDEPDADLADELPEAETVTIEISKETAQELADKANQAVSEVAPEAVEVDLDSSKGDSGVEVSPVEKPEVPEAPMSDSGKKDSGKKDCGKKDPVKEDSGKKDEGKEDSGKKDSGEACVPEKSENKETEKMAMQTHKLQRVGDGVVEIDAAAIKLAATPKKVKDIEGNVEAKVPRSDQKLGKEKEADSLMNKPNKDPEVPRKDAYMGKEKEADSLINKELKLPDVAVDSSFMGHEKEIQQGMPGINNEIKGTVIAKQDKNIKEAKQMDVVKTVEKEVEAKVPRSEQKLGEESKADSLINEPNREPDVPRGSAYMGKEKDVLGGELKGPDVPIDNAYMGKEKEVQQGMPGISDKYLKNVAKKDIQLERIASARKMKAIETAAKLLATNRISEDAYDSVIEALAGFEIDKIASVADKMYPKQVRQASVQADKQVHSGAAIVMESKDASAQPTLADKISGHFFRSQKVD